MSEFSIQQPGGPLVVPEVGGRAGRAQNPTSGPSFGEYLKSAVDNVNELQNQSDLQIRQFLAGEGPDIHTVILTANKAEMSFQLMMQIRNKLVQAYQELMRLQV